MSDIQRIGGSARFSAITIHNGVVYLAGQVSQLKNGDIDVQTKDVFAKIDALLAEAGTETSRLLSAQIWLKTMDDFAAMNAVWDDWVDAASPPVRACVEAPMAQPHYLIEVMVIAAL
jgi:enamine deaminase RidA (YjgF/YER057c/UK114 family)